MWGKDIYLAVFCMLESAINDKLRTPQYSIKKLYNNINMLKLKHSPSSDRITLTGSNTLPGLLDLLHLVVAAPKCPIRDL